MTNISKPPKPPEAIKPQEKKEKSQNQLKRLLSNHKQVRAAFLLKEILDKRS